MPAGLTLTPAANVKHVPILAFQAINTPANPTNVSPADFTTLMNYLSAQGYAPQKLSDYVKWRRGEIDLPRKSIVICFWNADESLYLTAWPILQGLKFPFAVMCPAACVQNEPLILTHIFLKPSEIATMVGSGLAEVHSQGFDTFKRYNGTQFTVTKIYKSNQIRLSWGGLDELVNPAYQPAPFIGTTSGLAPVTSTYTFVAGPRSYRGNNLLPGNVLNALPSIVPTQCVCAALMIDQLHAVGTTPPVLPLVNVYARVTGGGAYTLIKTGWQPSWTAGFALVTLDAPFTFLTGVSYDLQFVTQAAAAVAGELATFGAKLAGVAPTSLPASTLALITTPGAPVVDEVLNGALPLTRYYIKMTWVTAYGESLPSRESTIVVDPNYVLRVYSGPPGPGATGYNVYVGTTSGGEQKQNAAPIPFTTGWVMPNTGIVAGAAPPASNNAILSPPGAPTLSSVVGGNRGARSYYVETTYVNALGETVGSIESILGVGAGALLQVASPPALGDAFGYNVYVSQQVGPTGNQLEQRQNFIVIAIGTPWVEPATGLINGPSLPNYNTALTPIPSTCASNSTIPGFTAGRMGGDIYLLESTVVESAADIAARAVADVQRGLAYTSTLQSANQNETAHGHGLAAKDFPLLSTFFPPAAIRPYFPLQLWWSNLLIDRWTPVDMYKYIIAADNFPNRHFTPAYSVSGSTPVARNQNQIDMLSGALWDVAPDWTQWPVKLGYCYPWANEFYPNLRKHSLDYSHLTTRYVSWSKYADGTLSTAVTQTRNEDTLDNLDAYMQLDEVRTHPAVLLLISNYNGDEFRWDTTSFGGANTSIAHAIWANPTASINNLLNVIKQRHPTLQGIVLDFEQAPAADRALAGAWIQTLWTRMQAELPGRILVPFLPGIAVETPGDSSYWCDFSKWCVNCTYVNPGTYGQDGSQPIPIAPITQYMTPLLNFILTFVAKSKILIGMYNYGLWGKSTNTFTIAAGNITRAANVATVVTSGPHGQSTGAYVAQSNSSDASFNASAAITVINATTFTYASVGPNVLAGAGVTGKSTFGPWTMYSGGWQEGIKAADDNNGTWTWDAVNSENVWNSADGQWQGHHATPRSIKARFDAYSGQGYAGLTMWSVGHGESMQMPNAENYTGIVPLMISPTGASQQVNDTQGITSMGQNHVKVLQHTNSASLLAPVKSYVSARDFSAMMGGQNLLGRRARLRMGYSTENPNLWPVIEAGMVSAVDSSSVDTSWTVHIPDAKRATKTRCFLTATKTNPLSLSGRPMEVMLVVYQNHLGLGQNPFAPSSGWKLYVPGQAATLINPNPYLDVPTILAYNSGYFANHFVDFVLTGSEEGKAWIEKELVKTLGGYNIMNAQGQISPRYWLAPPLKGLTPVHDFTDRNVTSIPYAETAPVINQVNFRMDYDGSNFAVDQLFISANAQSQASSGINQLLEHSLVVHSKGLRAARQGVTHARLYGEKMFRRYSSGTPVWNFSAFHAGITIEVGDIVSLAAPLALDPITRTRGITNILCEVLDKQPSYAEGNMKWRLLDIRYLGGKAPFRFAPSGAVPAWALASAAQRSKYLFFAKDSTGLMSDNVTPGNTIYG